MIGETKNPPEDEETKFVYHGEGRDLSRDGIVASDAVVVWKHHRTNMLKMRPFRNIDKKGIAELYEKFGLLDTLFPITRSCELTTTDFSEHCGTCWFCEERKWGFGRYV
jgi:7-cyano-7-deazaguanine synthase in queuosine biosynthesis